MRAAGGVQGKECASSRPSWVACLQNGPLAVPWNLMDGQGARWVEGGPQLRMSSRPGHVVGKLGEAEEACIAPRADGRALAAPGPASAPCLRGCRFSRSRRLNRVRMAGPLRAIALRLANLSPRGATPVPQPLLNRRTFCAITRCPLFEL